MNPGRSILFHGALAVLVLLGGCSLPTDTEPAQWEMYVGVPVVDKKYTARDLIPDEGINGLAISFGDNGDADTVCLIKSDSLSYAIERELVTVDTSIIEKSLGAFPLQNTPPVDLQFSILEGNGTAEYFSKPLPVEVTTEQSKDKTIDGVRSVTFDETSKPLEVRITNASGAVLRNFHVVLESEAAPGNTQTIGSYSAENFPANTERIATIDMRGKSLYSTITVTIGVTVPVNSVVKEGDRVGVSFSLDGLVASDAEISDSLIEYSDEFEGSFGLADGIILDAIDIDDAKLYCEVVNPVKMQVGLKGIMNDAWDRAYAVEKNLEIRKDLASAKSLDSSRFEGQIISRTLFTSSASTVERFLIPLDSIRVFPSWDEDTGKSVLSFRYMVEVVSDGRYIHFNKDDVMIFKLMPEQFPFIRIKGEFVDPLTEEFTSEQDVGFEWEEDILDSLKKSFRFSAVEMGLSFQPGLPANSTIDSLELHMAVNTNVDPDDSIIVDRKIVGISPDSQYTQTVDIADLINLWPDTIGFNSLMGLPAHTGIELYNTKDAFGNYSNTLSIGVDVVWKLRIPLSWSITDDIAMELDRSEFDLGLEDLEIVNKLREKRVTLTLDVTNNTNAYFTLHAFGASKRFEDDLDMMILNPHKIKTLEIDSDSHVFRVFGEAGLNLPARGKTDSIIVQLDEKGIQALINDEDCVFRWVLLMPEISNDAFLAGDYLELKARAAVEGIGCTDSLLYWEDDDDEK